MGEINFSALVVTYNDSSHLRECLASLNFCTEKVVVDLGSSDSCVDIANSCGARVIQHAHVPIIEKIRKEISLFAKYDWIIILDPDEIFPTEIASQISTYLQTDSTIAGVSLPWQFYFRGKKLTTTAWGQNQMVLKIVNRNRCQFIDHVHASTLPLEGFHFCNFNTSAYIKHYWIDNYHQLFSKHWRYLKFEGEAKYSRGNHFSILKVFYSPIYQLFLNLFKFQGYKGGWDGIILSIFRSLYVLGSWVSLGLYQLKKRH